MQTLSQPYVDDGISLLMKLKFVMCGISFEVYLFEHSEHFSPIMNV